MASYEVIKPGFYNSVYYSPSERSVFSTSKPFTKQNPKPSFLGDEIVIKGKEKMIDKSDIDAALDKTSTKLSFNNPGVVTTL